MAWYNKYRPANFAAASGQTLVKKVLQNSVKSVFSVNPKVKHAYLFSGPRGTGKTSLARIFAKAINCNDQKSTDQGEACGVCDVCKNGQIDIIELDAASNTGIDNIRDLIEAANTPPFISRYKVYIIDEVHMLSKAAMNALLKTLEEPPSYIVFLMATTDPEKILTTILSRVTHLKLINHSLSDISKLLLSICKQENQVVEIDAIELIAKMAAGGLRDAINLLETVTNYGLEKYTEAEVAQILGVLPSHRLQELADSFLSVDFLDLKENIAIFEDLGTDPELLLAQLLDYLLTASLESYLDPKSIFNSKIYKELIQVLADLLSQNLAVASIKSALILIKLKLSGSHDSDQLAQKSGQKPSQKTAISMASEISTESIPLSNVGNFTDNFTDPTPKTHISEDIPKILEPEIDVQTTNTVTLPKLENGEVVQSDFMSLVNSSLKTDKTAPGKIKMLFGLLAFQDSDTVYLFAPSKIAITPLKSTDVNTWLLNLIHQNYGQNFSLKIVLDDDLEYQKIKNLIQKPTKPNLELGMKLADQAVPEPKQSDTIFESNLVDRPDAKPEPQSKALNQKIAEVASESNLEQNSEQDQNFKISDFYYLYGPLKDGTFPAGMKLLPKDGIKPKETKEVINKATEYITQSPAKVDHWQSELDDLDLE